MRKLSRNKEEIQVNSVGHTEDQLNLSFVCNENWNRMKTCGSGRFCAACKTQVQSFEKSSVQEIISAISAESANIHCVRVNAYQLENAFGDRRDLLNHKYRQIKSKRRSIRNLIGLSLLSLVLFLSGCYRKRMGCPAYAKKPVHATAVKKV